MKQIPEEEIQYLSVRQAARILGVDPSAVYQAITSGRLQPVRVLGKTALRRRDVEAYTPRAYRDRKNPTESSKHA